MKVMYMDESGKNIISASQAKVFLFGGLIIDQKNIYDALKTYKVIYQSAKYKIKKSAKKALDKEKLLGNITEKDVSDRMTKMFENFEFHAVNMISRKDKKRKNHFEENPWKYISEADIFRIINDTLSQLSPYIDDIYMFKMDKQHYLNYLRKHSIPETDEQSYDDMIKFIIEEYDLMLKESNSKGVLVPDRLDSNIREKFVDLVHKKNITSFWSEPITVESNSNAFTQLIDIITYFYYKIYIKDTKMANYRATDRAYKLYLKPKITVRDFCGSHDPIEL